MPLPTGSICRHHYFHSATRPLRRRHSVLLVPPRGRVPAFPIQGNGSHPLWIYTRLPSRKFGIVSHEETAIVRPTVVVM